MEKVTNIRVIAVKDRYTTKSFKHSKKLTNYDLKNSAKLRGVGYLKQLYKANCNRNLMLKIFIRLLRMITEDVMKGVVFTTPCHSKIHLGKFPKHKSRYIQLSHYKNRNYYTDHDWNKSLLINSVVYTINDKLKYVKIPYKMYKTLVKIDYNELTYSEKNLENYWDRIFEMYPVLEPKKDVIRGYMRCMFTELEEEVHNGYTFDVYDFLFYTYRTVKEQERWECSHRKKIYKKLKLWKKTHSLEV